MVISVLNELLHRTCLFDAWVAVRTFHESQSFAVCVTLSEVVHSDPARLSVSLESKFKWFGWL